MADLQQRFKDRTVIVTGAASGIGRASAIRIAAEGGRVACVDLNEAGLAETVNLIEQDGGESTPFTCDISDEGQVQATIDGVVAKYERLNALCNIAGILRATHSHEETLDDWNRIIGVNLTGTFLMCRAAIPHLLETKGYIVNSSSSAALGGHPWMVAYAASKGGILSLTRSLSCEYADKGLKVNAIIPGAIITPLHEQFTMPKNANAQLIQRIIPVVPYAQPEQVASVVAFLASEDASYINGSDLRVDGGMLS
jgi:NAD(P)-dependent dehydrogenase (short-subunit alcohol dehydrogenase family)